MTKSKIQPMIIDSLFEATIGIESEMNVLKLVLNGKSARIIYKEQSKGLITTLNNIERCLDKIGFVYLYTYYEDIKKQLNNDSVYILGKDGDYIVNCYYDSVKHISTMFIEIWRWLK